MRLADPHPEALSWAAGEAGKGFRVASCSRLEGTSFHANHVLGLVDGNGARRELVLRRWAGAGWELTDAEFNAGREAAILALLERSSVPAPRLIAADPNGERCRVPALLMTRLPGHPPDPSLPLGVLLNGLAGAISAIHSVPGAEATITAYRRYHEPADLDLPGWARDRALWKAAVEIACEPPPAGRDCFIHRDFHPGNTLWLGERLSGVVDWSYGSWGPAAVDAAHLRWNLARVVDLLDLVGAPGVELEPIERERLDPYLESVLTRL